MATVDLVVAFAIIAAGWAAVTALLRRSLRRVDVAATAEDDLAAKTAPWRAAPPRNRVADKFDLVGTDGRV